MVRERGERPESAVPPAAPPRPAPPLPIDWMKLDGRERQETLQVLVEWVPSIVASYELSEQIVPACWYLHEAMVHELLALFQYRNQQQFNLDLGPPPSAPLDFQYQLSQWVMRMRARVGDAGCKTNEHIAPRTPAWADRAHVAGAKWLVDVDEYAESLGNALAETNVGGIYDNQLQKEKRR